MVTQEPDSGRLGSAPKDLRDSSPALSFMESASICTNGLPEAETLSCLGPLGLRGSITGKSTAIIFSKTQTSEGALHILDIMCPQKGNTSIWKIYRETLNIKP